ncbi:MAG: GNAT family N-acetyltransferase [Hyphomicrobiaceae bacterium]|nr:GNAT family N-acetyltransferase [Hyphomicrobiaceae bacterium]MCC0024826.1 GNAT family N-acetyltransferase [Hyphomicrobiaceae bacterium]
MSPDLPILTERFALRLVQRDDRDAVYDYTRREDVARYEFWDVMTLEEAGEKIEEWMAADPDWPTGDRLVLAVTLRDTGALIGDCVLSFRDREGRQAEIGYTIHPDWHGKGVATETSEALLAVAFETYDLHRVYGRCDARNVGSWRVLEKLGMRREAHFREHALFKGDWDEEFYYAILQREWRERWGKG